MAIGFTELVIVKFLILKYSKYKVCTYLNAFYMATPNIVINFNIYEHFENFETFSICRLLTPAT